MNSSLLYEATEVLDENCFRFSPSIVQLGQRQAARLVAISNVGGKSLLFQHKCSWWMVYVNEEALGGKYMWRENCTLLNSTWEEDSTARVMITATDQVCWFYKSCSTSVYPRRVRKSQIMVLFCSFSYLWAPYRKFVVFIFCRDLNVTQVSKQSDQ